VKAALAIAVAAAGIAAAQTSSTLAVSNGLELRISATLGDPTGQQSIKVEFSRASGNSFYRIFRDQNNLAVFAYELVVNRNDEGTEFALAAKPVETEFAARFPQADGGKPVPTLSTDQNFTALRSGSRAQVGLFELTGLGLKVIDTIEVRVAQGGAAADVPLGAAQTRLRFSGLKVSINRTVAAAAAAHASVSGRYLMFYVPGRGAYFFSTSQPTQNGFLKAGSVEDSHLQFTWDNEIYDCVSESPILAGVRTGELWVYHDPNYKPSGNWTSPPDAAASSGATPGFFAAASDSLSWWLP
jgi:hypothetical protein